MVGGRKSRFVNFGLRIILTFLKIRFSFFRFFSGESVNVDGG